MMIMIMMITYCVIKMFIKSLEDTGDIQKAHRLLTS